MTREFRNFFYGALNAVPVGNGALREADEPAARPYRETDLGMVGSGVEELEKVPEKGGADVVECVRLNSKFLRRVG